LCINKLWFPGVLSYVMALFTTISETTVLCLICLAAINGNVSLFLILYKNRNLRTITNMYSLNLTAADTLVSVLGMPVTVVTIIKQRWVFGHTACVVLCFFHHFIVYNVRHVSRNDLHQPIFLHREVERLHQHIPNERIRSDS